MRIDLPQCGFKNCKYQFDGNCNDIKQFDKCLFARLIIEDEFRRLGYPESKVKELAEEVHLGMKG